MTIRTRIVAALLRLYPAAWRSEYGPELRDMLVSRRLSPLIVADVLWSAVGLRVRGAEPSTLVGVCLMLLVFAGLGWNIAFPPAYPHTLTAILQPSSKTLPTVTVAPLASDVYLLFLAVCGCWAHVRRRSTISQSGMATMRLSFIAGIPVMLAGVLMLSGVLDVVALAPGAAQTTFREHGFAYTFYSAQPHPPTPLSILLSPLFRLPESWLWGMLGALAGRWSAGLRSAPVNA